ncbi:hypothetical protein MNV49_006005 [Pseudohyphozyma bogoriensis]|nr:hypothetical protein MNV49_006005 [Pseudohyphozyma bogoriensis]
MVAQSTSKGLPEGHKGPTQMEAAVIPDVHEGPVDIVTIPYATLVAEAANPSTKLNAQIKTAFDSAPTSLGLLLVSDLPPEFAAKRERVLKAMNDFASLPEEIRDKYADAPSFWTIGWNFGRQIFNGRREMQKGAYCCNPNTDVPNVTPEQVEENPAMYRPNVWPEGDDCPELEPSLKDMSEFMFDVGSLVAGACDTFVKDHRAMKNETSKSVKTIIDESQSNKACLLHYFPPEGKSYDISGPAPTSDPVAELPDDRNIKLTWIFSRQLTSLCPAQFLFHPAVPEGSPSLPALPIPAPSSTAGLWIKTRDGKSLHAIIPDDCLAFQTGETLGFMSAGALEATTHFVHAGSEGLSLEARRVIDEKKASDPKWANVVGGTVSRETLAVFLQPDSDDAIVAETGETFGQFTKRVQARHY